ncbi:MAG: DUF2752 domain-containing protein [Sedimentisphaerales bacterium]|nr:DUF2752 domain-containing protein [Sedimentisphaerales bacterium]
MVPSNTDKKRWIAMGGLIAFAAGALCLFLFDPATIRFYPDCLFHRWTGLYCSGCGSTRAIHALLHGKILDALDLNPLMVIALPFILYGLGRQLYGWYSGKKPTGKRLRAVWIWVILIVVVTYTILRNIPVYPFTILAP